MRHTPIFLFLVLALLVAPNCWALNAAAHAECVGESHLVTVFGYYLEELGGEVYDGEISGLVFQCEAIGVCEPAFFYPETPLPFDPQPGSEGWLEYQAEFTITPPLSGVAYRYTPFGVRPDGSLVPTQGNCDADNRSYALASCPGVPIARGALVLDNNYGEYRIDLCSESCWTEGIWAYLDMALVEELSGQPLGNLLGRVVDVFGTRTYCTMPGGDYHALTGIALAPDGNCGPVPVEMKSWDSLKAMYR